VNPPREDGGPGPLPEMASELYEVFGAIRYSPAALCPPSLVGKKVVLKSKDGFISQVPAEAACLSLTIRDILVCSGVSDEVHLPLKQSTMTRVIEYLKYHQDRPAGEILTPLRGDSLSECGATAWDAKFIGVDKEMLFELILAASILGIQSLFILAGAKAALMNKGRAVDKLRKDFGLADDLPEEEVEDIQQMYNEAMAKKLSLPDEEAEELTAKLLAESSAVLAATVGAAANNDALDWEQQAGEFTVDIKSWRHANWRVVVLCDWRALAGAPEEVQDDRDLLFAAILASRGEALGYATPERREDRRLILEAVKHRGEALEEAARVLTNDREFILECVVANPEAMAHATKQMRADRDLLREAAKLGRGAALKGAAVELREDADFVLEMVGLDAGAYEHAPAELREKRDFALAAAARNGLALQYMSRVFQADRQIVATAVRDNNQAAAYSHTSCRRDLAMSRPEDGDAKTVGDLLRGEWRGEYRAPKPHMGPWMSLFVEDNKLTVAYQCSRYGFNTDKMIQFSASNTMTANMGQTNYISANSYLDKMPFYERPETEAITLMWGAVGGIGMRLKAFGSQDMLNATPEAQTTVDEAAKIMWVTVGWTGVPEWYNVQMYDPVTREWFLRPTAGNGSGGGYRGGESTAVPAIDLPEQKREMAEKEDEAEAKKAEFAEKEQKLPRKEAMAAPEPPLSPLAGWPGFAGAPAAETVPAGGGSFVEGARVMFTGMKAKNGMTGTLVKMQGNGRWKIRMDLDGALASLKEENLALVGTSAAQKPAVAAAPVQAETAPATAGQKANREKEERERFHIVGSWSNWDEPQEMTWDRSSRCYKIRLRLSYRFESFQILREGSWDRCLHPAEEISGLPGTDYALEGFDERRKCRGLHWTIGNHPQDQGATGTQYDVKLYVKGDGSPSRVSWRRVPGTAVRRAG